MKHHEELIDFEVKLFTPYADASKVKRFLNYVFDLFFIGILFIPVLFLVGFFGKLSGFEPADLEPYAGIMMLLWVFVYYLLMEWLFKGKTLAKFITRTQAVGQQGSPIDATQAFYRSLCRFIPFDNFTYLFLDSGFHDRFSKTRVVDLTKPLA